MNPLPLFARVTFVRRDEDTFEHDVLVQVSGEPAASVEGGVVSDMYENPRVASVVSFCLGVPEELARRLLLRAWEALVHEMASQGGSEIAWTAPDARPWLVRCLGEQDAARVGRAFGTFVKEGAAPRSETLSTTID